MRRFTAWLNDLAQRVAGHLLRDPPLAVMLSRLAIWTGGTYGDYLILKPLGTEQNHKRSF